MAYRMKLCVGSLVLFVMGIQRRLAKSNNSSHRCFLPDCYRNPSFKNGANRFVKANDGVSSTGSPWRS